MKNFLGKDGFIWWFGIVEDNIDPLKLGRCRVRCFGYHPPISDNAVATEDLPWALAIHSPNTWGVYNTPEVGDWVFGFFLDAVNGQEPAILGIIPGIPVVSERYFGKEPRNFQDTGLPIRSFSSIVNYIENLDNNWKLEDTIIWESKSNNKSKSKHGNFLLFYDEADKEQIILASSDNHIIRMSDKKDDSYISITSSSNNVIKIDDTKNIISIRHKNGALITIDSIGKIEIVAKDDIQINSKDITINSDNFTLNADNIDINSTGTLDLSGASGSITTTGALNVHASSTLDLQGSTINLN